MTVQSTKTVELESGTPIPKFPTPFSFKKTTGAERSFVQN